MWNVDHDEAGPAPHPGADWAKHDQYNARLDEITSAPGLADGAIPIAHLGCAIWLLLIVTGPERGTIWLDDRASDGGIRPAQLAGRNRLTFDEVYSDWLAQALGLCETSVRSQRAWECMIGASGLTLGFLAES